MNNSFEQSAKNKMQNIIKTAHEIENKVEFVDHEYIKRNEKFFSKFFEYSDVCNDIVSFIKEQTNFKYEPFKNISVDGILDSATKLVYVSKLSKVFDYPFIDKIDSNWKFDKLEDSFIKFIENNDSSTIIEYKLLKSLLGKFIILMCSDVERCFIQEQSNMNIDIKKYLEHWVSKMNTFANYKNNVSKGWSVFINTLFDSKEVFNYKSQEHLHELLKTCYSSHFLMESLAANILKTFQTSILIDYFHAIKYVFIWVRMISILIQNYMNNVNNKLNSINHKESLINDIYMLTCVIVSMYEDNYFISSILPKSLPTNENLSEETQLYFINHTIKGPQYMILKQLELSACCVLNIR